MLIGGVGWMAGAGPGVIPRHSVELYNLCVAKTLGTMRWPCSGGLWRLSNEAFARYKPGGLHQGPGWQSRDMRSAIPIPPQAALDGGRAQGGRKWYCGI